MATGGQVPIMTAFGNYNNTHDDAGDNDGNNNSGLRLSISYSCECLLTAGAQDRQEERRGGRQTDRKREGEGGRQKGERGIKWGEGRDENQGIDQSHEDTKWIQRAKE